MTATPDTATLSPGADATLADQYDADEAIDADGVVDAVTLGGRRFRFALPLTVAQHDYWDRQFRRAGAARTPETVAEYRDALDSLKEAGVIPHLLAAFLVDETDGPAGAVPWVKLDARGRVDLKASHAAADRVAEFVWTLSDDVDLLVYTAVLDACLRRFFPCPAGTPEPSPASTNAQTNAQSAPTEGTETAPESETTNESAPTG